MSVFVSVVIPVFNAEKHIFRCLSALERQTFKDFEAIFVDDCSQDNSVEQLLHYAEDSQFEIKVLTNTINRGPAIARNVGVNASNSEFIAFCDSDDWYEDDFLEKMVTTQKNNRVDLVFCGCKVVSDKGKVQERRLPMIRNLDVKKMLCLGVDSLCMTMVRRDIIKRCPFPDLRNGEDMAMIPLLICQSNKQAVVNDCLYNYYRREDSASENVSISILESLKKSFSHIEENIPSKYKIELEYIGVQNLLYNSLIILYTCSSDRSRALDILEEFEKKYPNWYNNPYYKLLPFYKKVVLGCCYKRCFWLLKLIAVVREYLK